MQIPSRTFLVTGGGSGLGAATAQMLVSNDANVVIADIHEERGVEFSRQLGGTTRFVRTDVTSEADVNSAIETCIRHFGAIHGAINCAGVAPGERVVGKQGPHALASFRRAIEINLIGSFNVMRLAAHAMSTLAPLPSGERGVVINTSSVAADEGQIGQAAYAASKAGVNGLTLPAARELAKFGIRVVTIAPGIFETPLMGAMTEEVRNSLAQQIPFPSRFGQPQEYAALVKHVVENEYLNGTVIRLDGAVRMGAR